MAIYVIGDLHLAISTPKSMDIFTGWDNYMERIKTNWEAVVKPEDTVVIAGDISWCMRLDQGLEDFLYIENLPGTKLLIKGNHDYWWSTAKKMETFFTENGLNSLKILHNKGIECEDKILAGSRGWIFENGDMGDRKIIDREANRIEMSLSHIKSDKEKILFLHYPPIYNNLVIDEYFDIMEKHNVKKCYYGHLHGYSLKLAFKGNYRGVDVYPISADYLKFAPFRVL